ncbi:MAG: carboxypeptidase-like regulatory domain-containing protein [Planctomycetota bacterium]
MTARLWISGLLVAAGAAGAYIALDSDASTTEDVPEVRTSNDDTVEPVAQSRSGAATSRRDTSEVPTIEPEADPSDIARLIDDGTREPIVVVGRVIDQNELPVAGASVAVSTSVDPRSIFERMQNGDMPDPREFFQNRGRNGMRQMFDDARRLMGPESIGESVITDVEGRFEVRGLGRTEGNVELLIDHPEFAPASERRPFDLAEGDVVLGDVVVEAGVAVTGRVLDADGLAIPGVKVSIEGQGRGGRGGRGGPGGFPGFGGNAVADLLPELETDSGGYFRFDHIPGDRVQVRAELPGFVPTNSERVETEGKTEVDLGTLTLAPGAILRGIVVDEQGQPVVGANVSARFSRESFNQRNEGLERDQQREARQSVAAFFRANQETETDDEGRFELDQVPAAALVVEVDHESHIEQTIDPVDPTTGAALTVILGDLLSVQGMIVDAATGAPVEKFAIAARRVDGFGGPGGPGNGRDRGGRGDRGNRGPEGAQEDPERVARQIEREQQAADRAAMLGGSGRIPGRTEDPTSRPDGRFEIEGLQPGNYVFDIDAPGYVKIAAGEIELSQDTETPELRFEVVGGVTLQGVITDKRDAKPVANARVSLRFPDDGQQGGFAGFGGRGGRGGFFGGGGRSIQSVRTDDAGRYSFKPQLPGTYALHVDARDFPGYRDEAFELRGQGVVPFDLAITNGTRLFGTVTGLEESQNARVVLTHTETNDRRTVRVDNETNEYAIEGLAAGGYFASVEIRGRGQRDWRARVGAFVASQNGDPDFFIPEGGEIRHDLDAAALQLPSVTGRVLKNGLASSGLSVQLVSLSTDEQNGNAGFARRLAGLFRANIDAETGNFEISSVPPGDYRLEVQSGGGGRGGRGGRGGPQLGGGGPTLGSQIVSVRKGGAADVFLNVQSGSLALRVVDAAGNPVTQTGRLRLVKADEAYGLEPDQWRGLESLQTTRIRNGELDYANAPVGGWRVEVTIQGFETMVEDFTVLASEQATQITIQLTAQ